MSVILAGITSLLQYLAVLEHKPIEIFPLHCPHCGKSGLWLHGYYSRKADRLSGSSESLNPIFIQRFFCSSCRRTCSVLPECIPPRRWYLWEIQQTALVLLLSGKSLYAAAKELIPSRHTMSRWLNRFKEQFRLHKDTLHHHLADLGRITDFASFWQACLNKISLAQAMRLCHVAGVPVP